MTDYAFPPSFRATDADDNPLAGGAMRFYAAGTTTPKAVYSNPGRSVSLGTVVNLDSSGVPVSGANTPVLIYYGTGDYKYRLYNAAAELIFEFDNIAGYVEPAEEVTTALSRTPVVSKTSPYTVTADDRSVLINANPTGGPFVITLPSAVTMGDGFRVGVRHSGTANQVSIVSNGSQFIRAHKVLRSYALVGMGETAWFVADGADWIVDTYSPPDWKAPAPYFRVLDRIASPPANPDAGARYIINGTPIGAWATLGFAEHDIAEADGNGSWVRLTPESGWMAFDADEEQTLQFKDGTWENFQIDPGTSTLKTLVVQYQESSGTNGGTAATGAWTTAALNTSVVNTIGGSSLAANIVTLPAGRYRVTARKTFVFTIRSQIRFKTADDDSIIIRGESVSVGSNSGGESDAASGATCALNGEFEIAATTDFILQYYCESAGLSSSRGLGAAAGIGGVAEVYSTLLIEDLASLQGPKGDQGDPGPDGLDAAYWYQWSSATSGDPGTGKIRTDHATPASVTEIAVSQTDAAGADLSSVIASWDDSTSDDKARLRFHKEGSTENFFEFLITGTGTDQGSYWTFPVSLIASNGTLGNGNDLAVLVLPTGDKGDPGTTVPDIDGLTEDTANDDETDYLIAYDASASAHKKVLPKNLGFTPAGSGARLRTMQGKLRESVSVADYRLVIDSDDTNSFTRAIAALSGVYGGSVYIPPGAYDLAPFTIDRPVTLYGDGPGSVNLVCNHATADFITVASSRCHLSGFSLDSSVTRTNGYYINCTGVVRCTIRNLYATKHFLGILLYGAAIMDLDTIEFRDGEDGTGSGCIVLDGELGLPCVEVSLHRIVADKSSGDQQDFGIKLINTDATHIVSCDIIRSGRDLFINPGQYDIVSSTYVVDSYFDTSDAPGILVALDADGCVQFTHFVATWTGSHPSTAGVYIDNTAGGICDGFDFIGHTSYGNQTGLFVDGFVKNVRVNGGAITANSAHGVSIGNDVISFSIDVVTIGPTDNQSGNGAYGISVEAGFAGAGKIRNCILDGNTSGALAANGATLELWGNSPGTVDAHDIANVRYGGSLLPRTNEVFSVGSVTFSYTGLFLGSGAIINFANSDVTITHSSNRITFAGLTDIVNEGTLYTNGDVYAKAATVSAVAGGASAFHTFFGGPGIYSGSGAPTVSAPKGSLYLRTDGSGTGDRAYINTNGSTTWTALTTAA